MPKAAARRPTVLMIKILVLQQLYNLADNALEYQLLKWAANWCAAWV